MYIYIVVMYINMWAFWIGILVYGLSFPYPSIHDMLTLAAVSNVLLPSIGMG